jgi:uncharacterized protein YjbI with pentapeptide repeats
VAVLLMALAIVAWGLHSGFSQILRAWERAQLIARIGRAQTVLSREVVQSAVQMFQGDESLRSHLLFVADNRELATTVRLNARIIAAALGNREKRWYLESITWNRSSFRRGELSDVTFRTGVVKNVEFEDVALGGVVWNSGPDFGLSGSAFVRFRFYGGQFADTNVIDVDFTNCIFSGTTLDVSGFGAVRFNSKPSKQDSEVITDGEVTIFENATIANCVEPLAQGTIDFGGPANEGQFSNAVFESCRFRGLIRLSWFNRCHFDRCIFLTSVNLRDLETAGNFVTDCVNSDEACN